MLQEIRKIEENADYYRVKKVQLQTRFIYYKNNSLPANETLINDINNLREFYKKNVINAYANLIDKGGAEYVDWTKCRMGADFREKCSEDTTKIVSDEKSLIFETTDQLAKELFKGDFCGSWLDRMTSQGAKPYPKIKAELEQPSLLSFLTEEKAIERRFELYQQKSDLLALRQKQIETKPLEEIENFLEDVDQLKKFYIQSVFDCYTTLIDKYPACAKYSDFKRRIDYHSNKILESEFTFFKETLQKRLTALVCDMNKKYQVSLNFHTSFVEPFLEGKFKFYSKSKQELTERLTQIYQKATTPELRKKIYDNTDSGLSLPSTVLLTSKEQPVKQEEEYLEPLKLSKVELDKIEKHLEEKVIGQNGAQKKIIKALKVSAAGLGNPKKPVAAMMFAGPTGVGKTEIVKVLAEELKPFGYDMMRVDLNQYKSEAEGCQLFGAKRGYQDSEKDGELTAAFKKNTKQIVLFDEAEKAHKSVLDNLLTILDEAYFVEPKNLRRFDCKDALFFFTTNAGSLHIPSISDDKDSFSEDLVKENIRLAFKPEFLGRLDVVLFNPLNSPQLKRIIEINLDEIAKTMLKRKEIELVSDDKVVDYFINKAKDGGIRKLKTKMHQKITLLVADKILEGEDNSKRTLNLSLDQGKLSVKRCRFEELFNELD